MTASTTAAWRDALDVSQRRAFKRALMFSLLGHVLMAVALSLTPKPTPRPLPRVISARLVQMETQSRTADLVIVRNGIKIGLVETQQDLTNQIMHAAVWISTDDSVVAVQAV